MIIDRYDLENKSELQKEIMRQINLLAKVVTDEEYDILQLGFTIKLIKRKW